MKVFNSENVPSMNGSGLAGYIDTTYTNMNTQIYFIPNVNVDKF